VAQKEDEREDC